MKQSTPPVGANRTGVQMAPLDIRKLVKEIEATPPSPPGDESMMNSLRSEYHAQAQPVGSVPPPATGKGAAKGALKAGADMAAGSKSLLLLDKLGERLAFERSGTRLYDALINKFQSVGDNGVGITLEQLQQIRSDEASHFAMVAVMIQQMGGDPTAQTPCADVGGVEAMGLMQVITDPRTTMAQSLHAILTAELTDNAGWETLILLSQEQGYDAMARDFSSALQHEQEHLSKVRGWYESMLGIKRA